MSHKQPEGTRIADMRKLQEIMHYHGLEQFQQLLKQAYFNASEEMEHINTEVSEAYSEAANSLPDEESC